MAQAKICHALVNGFHQTKEDIMIKIILAVSMALVIAACGSTDPYEKRAKYEREKQEKAVETSIDRAPKWMSKLPESKDAVYANGSAVSRDFSMADMKAKTIALSSICMAAGGEVDKSSKVFMTDTEAASAETSEVAIRSMCRRVDVSGAEVVEIVRIPDNGRYRTFVLMSLPLGEANTILRRKDQLKASEAARQRSKEAFSELN